MATPCVQNLGSLSQGPNEHYVIESNSCETNTFPPTPVPTIRAYLRVGGSSKGISTEISPKIWEEGEMTQIWRKGLSFSRTMRKEGTRLPESMAEPYLICQDERSTWDTGESCPINTRP